MRASRLLTILLTLHTRGRVSAQQLADELEVSLRTVYRDVEALNGAGIPVYATRGRAGGFQLLEGYRTKLTGLTADEADALFLAGLPGAAADLGPGQRPRRDPVQAARLAAARVPRPRRPHPRPVPPGRAGLAARGRRAAVPAGIADAVWTQHRLQVRYERANRTVVDRVLEPLGLVLKAGVWYLVAACRAGSAPRTYRLSRVHAAAVLDEQFERPDGFDLQEHWADYQQDYEARIFNGTARIRLSGRAAQLLFLIGTPAARAGRAAMSAPDRDGWTTDDGPDRVGAARAPRAAAIGRGGRGRSTRPNSAS